MKRIPAWLSYFVLRLVFLAVPLLICWLLLGIPLWLSAIFAIVIAFSLSTLLLYKLKLQVIEQMKNAGKRRTPRPASDEAIEDSL